MISAADHLPSFPPFMMNTKSAILIALAWRILIAVSTYTFFQPDEFYQSLEAAHHAVFGYGAMAISPGNGRLHVRSVFFPSIYKQVYWLLKVMGLDSGPLLVRWLP